MWICQCEMSCREYKHDEFRNDYTHNHYGKNTGEYLKPHKHVYEYNNQGQPVKPDVPVVQIP